MSSKKKIPDTSNNILQKYVVTNYLFHKHSGQMTVKLLFYSNIDLSFGHNKKFFVYSEWQKYGRTEKPAD